MNPDTYPDADQVATARPNPAARPALPCPCCTLVTAALAVTVAKLEHLHAEIERHLPRPRQ